MSSMQTGCKPPQETSSPLPGNPARTLSPHSAPHEFLISQ